ncbi:protein dopey-2 [Erinaceus europaeus]|uniref:Protein dopey-2 n=1 Tax=Erinaceus europaeus TaxID=9365 RepID=A0ABM3Y0P9_ERIEU|nr:protein dopey-2 [Erinaceus europaeus]
MSVRPVLLGLYEKYFLPLHRLLLPSLQAFVAGLLPGLEEGSDIYDRTDALLVRLSVAVGREPFYAALWGSVLGSPAARLPASLFLVGHISRDAPGREQRYMLGADPQLTVKALCALLSDSNVLVQRNSLELVLFFFPFCTSLDPQESAVPLRRADVVEILAAATHTLLRRDMSLNRRLYAWLLGSDIKGNTIMPETKTSKSYENPSLYFFETYSKDLLVEALGEILHQEFTQTDGEERLHAYLKPFRLLLSLLDKPEIGPQVVEDLFLEVIRAFYSYCSNALGSDLTLSYTQSGCSPISTIKENKHASEIVKTVNLLLTSLSADFLWDYMTRCFLSALGQEKQQRPGPGSSSPPPSVSELCTLLVFLLGVIPLELYSEVQTQYLPQMLGCLVQALAVATGALSLPELTLVLKTCFKVLSKVQMPPSYLDLDSASGSSSPTKGDHPDTLDALAVGPGDEEAAFPPLRSEDSGIGLSASSPELCEHLRMPQAPPEQDRVWRQGGSVQGTLRGVQDLLAALAHKHVFGVELPPEGEEETQPEDTGTRTEAGQRDEGPPPPTRQNSGERPLGVPQFKQMLSDLFTVRGSPFRTRSSEVSPTSPSSSSPGPGSPSRKVGATWAVEQVAPGPGGPSEDCREALAAACHLLLDCATFPVYLAAEELEQLCDSLFQPPGTGDISFPAWLKSLMTICCCVSDCSLQNVAIATLLEVINHSQSLALVIEDKVKRQQRSGHSPFFSKLQMVTVPPVAPGILKVIAEKTDFYQRVAHVLWDQLDKESREHHVPCVDLFYRLHCLAPTASVCEDIICHALLDPDKETRMEALFRFSVIWHLTRETQGSRVASHNRSFDRSLFVVLDSLSSTDGAISAAAQGWLVRALSLGDVIRILEPVLLLLLQPRTQRTSIQCLKPESIAEERHRWLGRGRPSGGDAPEDSREDLAMDREAMWAEVEREPESPPAAEDLPDGAAWGAGDSSSEHTESADTSWGPSDGDTTSSASSSRGPRERRAPSLSRVDSDGTQASESLSSDEDGDRDGDLDRDRDRDLGGERGGGPGPERQVPPSPSRAAPEAPFQHVLLYLQPYDARRVLYAFSVLDALLRATPRELTEALGRARLDTSATAHLNLVSNLLARHQEALAGRSFYGRLPPQAPGVCPHSGLLELLVHLCLSFLCSYYPRAPRPAPRDVLGNRDVQVKSVQVLARLLAQLAAGAPEAAEPTLALLQRCRVQELALRALVGSMHAGQARPGLLQLGPGQARAEHPLQLELLGLLRVLIGLEHRLGRARDEAEEEAEDAGRPALAREWRRAVNFQQAIGALSYVRPHPLPSQGLLVAAVARGLQPAYGYAMHAAWVGLVTHCLPYFGKSLGWTVSPFLAQICKNLDELARQHEGAASPLAPSSASRRENIAPDYPLTLLEGLTTIGHFCLLEQPNQSRKSASASDQAHLRNARNAVLEELPRILNTMALLWDVLRREEAQRRPADLLGATRGSSSSVYFKTTKILRQKILDFLNPLTGPLGVQFLAAVATVWSKKREKSRGRSRTQIVPAPSACQLTLVDLACALSTLQTDALLHLVREVVKRPPQIHRNEKSAPLDVPVLQFCCAYIQRLPALALQESFPALLGVLRESVQLNLAPPGSFLLLSMLNDFVTRTPSLESKRDQKDLQDITQKLLEAVGNIAGSSLEQTSWLSRSLEVKAQPQVSLEDSDAEEDLHGAAPSAVVSASAPSVYSVQALSLLAEVLAPLLDMVYRSDEKDKAVPLVSRLLCYVFPYLRNHSTHNAPSFRAGSQLLAALSGYACTRRAWRKEALELLLEPAFFQMDTACPHWKAIIDHLLTHEKTMFKDLMSMQSSSLKLFSSAVQKAMLLKRQAFAVFSGELDQYHLYLPLIQERLTDNLRVGQTPLVAAQMFLFFRVLLLRISPQHLTSLWPIMFSELIQKLILLEEELKEDEDAERSSRKASGAKEPAGEALLSVCLSACKFLDTALAFPPDRMPLFQAYRWAFVPEVDTDGLALPSELEDSHQECKPHTVKILELLTLKYGELGDSEETSVLKEFPLLRQRSVSSLKQLLPFFQTLNWAFRTPSSQPPDGPGPPWLSYPGTLNSSALLSRLEACVEEDFLECPES